MVTRIGLLTIHAVDSADCSQTVAPRAAFVTWVEASCSNFAWLYGRPNEFTPRPGVTRTYCADCGTPLTYRNSDHPGSIDVTAGSLDDPSSLVPDDHVWFDRKLPWIPTDDGLPRYGRGRRAEED